jgi:glycosyltransferase involved in cell wall biosynthesis
MDASLVMPAHDKRDALARVLAALRWQTHRSFEVIVVDDGSTDGTAELAAQHDVQVVRVMHGGRSAARNAGLRAARGRIAIFCDADTIPGPDFIAEHVAAHADGPVVCIGTMLEVLTAWTRALSPALLDTLATRADAAVLDAIDRARETGAVELVSGDDIARDFAALECVVLGRSVHNFHDAFTGTPRAVPWVTCITQNVSMPRGVLCDVGGFDEDFVGWGIEDIEVGYRLHRAGVPFRSSERAVTYHQSHLEPHDGAQWTQRWREPRANYRRFITKHPAYATYLWCQFLTRRLDGPSYDALASAPVAAAALAEARALAEDFADSEWSPPVSRAER